uniref:PPPDE domain-containing protein n=1 Tax=Oryza nivara TaxID=4536 RepID=A0A0E0H3V4_ORYNI
MAVQNGGGDGSGSGAASVVVNVYDLTPMNNYLYWFGLGIFHSGIEVHGVEYGFGAHEFPTSGVFEVEPKNCPGFVYRSGDSDVDKLDQHLLSATTIELHSIEHQS